ncbi:hypothetical protein DFR72_103651 [Lentzea flaviverrucosa]|uniref:Uncharacterized protein n=1 Tax=Lentzea flaviverrucosa TaxID=200379 RepID=A0A1H8ZUF8_9PSEU|nr:hypothetical protein DFR72_103651 [Lentzea flaviverrucosa]SEP67877.1 hypothetical protein SAMN05216195_1017 [Lentzea flaviverrucosa]
MANGRNAGASACSKNIVVSGVARDTATPVLTALTTEPLHGYGIVRTVAELSATAPACTRAPCRAHSNGSRKTASG